MDTARVYGLGKSERTLGRWIEQSGRRSDIVLVTKGCHPDFDPDDVFGAPWEPRLSPESLRADLSESLDRLRTDYIDLYLLHRDDERVPVGSIVKALNEEQERGRISAFGASNWRVERIAEANEYAKSQGLDGFVVSSPSLSLPRPVRMYYPGTLHAGNATREWHRVSQFPMLAWATLAAGFMSGKYGPGDEGDDLVREMYYSEENFERLRRAQEIGVKRGATPLQIGLSFVLHQPFPTIALVGPSTVAHLSEALGALNVELTSEEMSYLDLEA